MNDIEYDEFCDPNNPKQLKYDDIEAAVKRLEGNIVKTPLLKAANLTAKLHMDIYLKLETRQYTGSSKERGVRNTLELLTDAQKKNGIVTATTGNHGIAMSYHCSQLGIYCIVVMPDNASVLKVERVQFYGAKVVLQGASLKEAKRHAMMIQREKQMFYVNGFDHPYVCEGNGTIAIEILEEQPGIEAVLVPVGGGSLIAGIATAIKHLRPSCQVYGISTEKTKAFAMSLDKNERIVFPVGTSLADGLGVNTVGVNPFYNVKLGIVEKCIVVSEDWVARAMMHLANDEKLIAEGAGAVSIAAIMAGLFPHLRGKKVACVISGGNVDNTVLGRALERGMGAEGRLIKFNIVLEDNAGALAQLCARIASTGAALRDLQTQQCWLDGNVHKSQMTFVAETRNWEHARELMQVIKQSFVDCFFPAFQKNFPSGPGAGLCHGPCTTQHRFK